MSFKSSLLNASTCLLELFYPKVCMACGTHLFTDEEEICKMCLRRLPRTGFEKHPDDNAISAMMWGRCEIKYAYALYVYRKGERLQQMLHSLKYRGNKPIGSVFGRELGRLIKKSDIHFDVLLPVPLHPRKMRQRGFNQSMVIAKGMQEILDTPIDVESIHRQVFSSTQTKKNRFERWKNVEHIFHLADSNLLKGKSVLVVDDVITTGSTMEAVVNKLSMIEGVSVSLATVGCALI